MNTVINAGNFSFNIHRPLLMGIVNVTPDSFSDGGKFFAHQLAIEHALQLREEGADILDVGGESTRPDAEDISEEEELRRVIPVIQALVAKNIPVSIDTQKTSVMEEAIAAGACLINDVNALQAEGALEVAAQSSAALCIMHRQGNAKTMQQNPTYGNVVKEVKSFLAERADVALAKNIDASRIILDPGFGFGKNKLHNLELLNELQELVDLGYPVLAGLSRKRLLGELTGRSPDARLAASITAAVVAVQNGASIVRIHDVAATKDALAVINALSSARGERKK